MPETRLVADEDFAWAERVSIRAWIHSEQHRTRPGTCGDLGWRAGVNAVTSRERCCRFRSCS